MIWKWKLKRLEVVTSIKVLLLVIWTFWVLTILSLSLRMEVPPRVPVQEADLELEWPQ